MIRAVIFDMDGLLIDSEPLWREAEVNVFSDIGVPLTFEKAAQTTGLRIDEVVKYWHERHPWKSPSQTEVHKRIDQEVLNLIKQKGMPKDGVEDVIALCAKFDLPMAIASSSSTKIIMAVIEKLGINNKLKVIHSAEFEEFGKPHPDVYINAARKLGVSPSNCLTFEDSVNGVISAKAAKMHCIAIPEPELRGDKRFGIADIEVASLKDVTSDMIKNP
jgi:mannitol-1-/sugar-/sorbitol-6-/2-deoxyglucose-6-phosphatase